MLNNLKKLIVTTSLLVYSIAGYSQETYSLTELKTLKFDEKTMGVDSKNNENAFRQKAMKDAAMAIGAQHGYVKHMTYLKEEILDKQVYMDDIFDFSLIMKIASGKFEEMHLLPPVIRKTKDTVTVSADSRRIEIRGTEYEILKHARLVSIAPNWRQYLIYDQPVAVNKPADILLPKNAKEEENWAIWVQEGWLAGIAQAEHEMTYRVRKLGQDFKGMLTYTEVLLEGKIKKPVVSSSTQNIRSSHNEMILDEKIIQLAMPATLNADTDNWEPLFLDTRDSLKQPIEKDSHKSLFKGKEEEK